jgi:hypothetical protein
MRTTVFLAFGMILAAATAEAQMTAPATPAPAGMKPSELHPATPAARSVLRLTRQFERANVSHTGRLTAAEAQAYWPWAARHFAQIDRERRGYLTLDEIRAWRKEQRR